MNAESAITHHTSKKLSPLVSVFWAALEPLLVSCNQQNCFQLGYRLKIMTLPLTSTHLQIAKGLFFMPYLCSLDLMHCLYEILLLKGIVASSILTHFGVDQIEQQMIPSMPLSVA
jgi:hypothetical protein